MKLPELEPIAALATAPGMAAIAVIRVSGKNIFPLVDNIFKAKNKSKKIATASSHSLLFGDILEDDKIVDEVLVSIFKNPHSYTGENTVEISSHGSPYIQQRILELLYKQGIRPAKEGEFTQRAYLNKKLDLSQAEAVMDLIASESEADHQIALQQMRGGFSNRLKDLREQLIEFASLLELELDFSEEDVEFANREKFNTLLNEISKVLKEMIASFQYGNVIKEGVPVAIAGKPNAGKSSLLNALFNEEKAIVSDIAGTTRDSIEDTLVIEGYKFRFIDTAGLRNTEDSIEKIGVKKAKEKVSQAKVLLYLFDEKDTTAEEIIHDVKKLYHSDLKVILVQNKIDTTGGFQASELKTKVRNALLNESSDMLGISAQNPESVKMLTRQLVQYIQDLPQGNIIVSNSRHLNALRQALISIQQTQEGLNAGISGDFIAQDVRQALYHIGEITGEVDVDQDILGTIFGRFCIGK